MHQGRQSRVLTSYKSQSPKPIWPIRSGKFSIALRARNHPRTVSVLTKEGSPLPQDAEVSGGTQGMSAVGPRAEIGDWDRIVSSSLGF